MISICIPSYNYGQFLPDAIESCLSSSHEFELVVLDNASTDNTADLKRRYVSDGRVRWFRNESTIPMRENWNKSVSLANGDWVKVLQADDALMPGAIDRLSEIVNQDQQLAFHAHLCEVVDRSGKRIRGQTRYTSDGDPLFLEPGAGLPLKLRQIARLKENTSNIFRAKAWSAVGGYPADVSYSFDVLFNVRLMANYGGGLWSEELARIRRHSGSDSAKGNPSVFMSDIRFIQQEIFQLMKDPDPEDRRAAGSWTQYKMVELFAQRIKTRPREALGFLLREIGGFRHISSLPGALAICFRKYKTGDVQKMINRLDDRE